MLFNLQTRYRKDLIYVSRCMLVFVLSKNYIQNQYSIYKKVGFHISKTVMTYHEAETGLSRPISYYKK